MLRKGGGEEKKIYSTPPSGVEEVARWDLGRFDAQRWG
jgi:DNA-binding PadR family transcriptional regulator